MIVSAILTGPFQNALSDLPKALSPSVSWVNVAFGNRSAELRKLVNDHVQKTARQTALSAPSVLKGNLRRIIRHSVAPSGS